jgi:hypothetical protein
MSIYGGGSPEFFDPALESDFPADDEAYAGARLYAEPRCELGDRCLTIPLETVLPESVLVGDFSTGTILPDEMDRP